ncbi:MAG: alkyl hydroperoxide reductase, partial [Planctomycetaceae bacterium]
RYEDAAWQQEASARVDHAHMIRDRVMPDQIHNFAHNNEWLCRNLVHVGRWRDAVDLAKNMISLPRHPEYNTLSKRGSTYYGRLRLFETLTKYELWDEAIALCHSAYLEPADDAKEQVKRLRVLGTAYFRSGDVENGRKIIAELEERLQRERDDQRLAEQDAEETIVAPLRPPAPPGTHVVFKPDAETAKKVEQARKGATKPFHAPIRALERALDELRGRAVAAEADYKTAYDLLKKAGGVEAGDLARVQLLAGDGDAAEAALRKECERGENEVLPRAHLVDLLWQRGDRDEAAKAFEELRSLSGSIEFGSPVFDRLTPIALELGLPEDWRMPATRAEDIGDRPDLATLGPFRWAAYEAPAWTLADADGQTVSLSD